MRAIEVLSPGPLTTIQDLGRSGWAHIGVPLSGAADRCALGRANLLVGNPPGAAALETTLAGPKLRAMTDTVIALTGARVNATAGEKEAPMDAAVELAAGEVLSVGIARSGLRTYIAFSGGLDAPLTMGSASTDLLTGLGPGKLARGDVLGLRRPTQMTVEIGVVVGRPRFGSTTPSPSDGTTVDGDPQPPTLRVLLGPRQDWFTAEAISVLTSRPFTVTPASNRIGVRLEGPPLARATDAELPSEGLVAGALQVTGDGQPILLLADHPTTGGYPVIAVVVQDDLTVAAQLRPGQRLCFSVAG